MGACPRSKWPLRKQPSGTPTETGYSLSGHQGKGGAQYAAEHTQPHLDVGISADFANSHVQISSAMGLQSVLLLLQFAVGESHDHGRSKSARQLGAHDASDAQA